MSLAPRIDRSKGVTVSRSQQVPQVPWPIKIWVAPQSRANFRIVSIASSKSLPPPQDREFAIN